MTGLIRKAKENDINGILELLKQVLSIHHEIRPDIFKSNGTKYNHEELKNKISNGDLIFIYEENGQILGHIFCVVKKIEETQNTYPRKELFIDDLCVDKNNYRKHIGSYLLEYAENYAKEHQIDTITLDAWVGNDAIKFYEDKGYTKRKIVFEKKNI